MAHRPVNAIDTIQPTKGGRGKGLVQPVTMRFYPPSAPTSPRGWGSFEIDGVTYPFASPEEGEEMFSEYLRRGLQAAAERAGEERA